MSLPDWPEELAGRRRRETPDSPRSAHKRASIYTSQSSRESVQTAKRATDIRQTSAARYKMRIVETPLLVYARLYHEQRTPPLSLNGDPALMPETKQRGDMDKVPDVLLALQGEQSGDVEIDHSKLAGTTVFALRCFGAFEVRRGVGAYGKGINACLRRMSAYGEEEALDTGSR